MRIVIDTRKTLEQNAADHFERGKKAKRKLEGAKRAVQLAKSRLIALEREESAAAQARQTKDAAQQEAQERSQLRAGRAREWYERLRWFISSDGFLCVGGRDSTTNELVVKRHASAGDVVFHTDMAGSPFVVVKSDGKPVPQATLEEAAQFCACYSRAWKNNFGYLEVFSVAPEQLTKTPNSGESLAKGAFVVRGSVRYYKPKVELCIGRLPDGRMMMAATTAILARCGRGRIIEQGNEKSSDVAKRLAKEYDAHVDDILPLLPAGGVKLGKEAKRDARNT